MTSPPAVPGPTGRMAPAAGSRAVTGGGMTPGTGMLSHPLPGDGRVEPGPATPRTGSHASATTATPAVEGDGPRPTPRGIRPRPTRPPATGGTPSLPRLIREDLQAVLERDPSCSGRREALLHPGWQGLALHRLAHRRYTRGHRLTAAVLTRLARLLTGMEIHAGARIGRRAFIDHGFGVVIGETAVIGDDVTLYHGVTLGSRGWLRDSDGGRRRHPVLGDRVLIGTGASVLGPVTIGDGRRIAAHALVLHDLPTSPPATHRRTR